MGPVFPEESYGKGAIMKLMNPWKLLFRPSGRKLRHRPHGFHIVEALAAEVLEVRQLLSIAAPQVTLAIQATSSGTNVTLASTDINNPNVIVTRSGNFVVFTGNNGTQITYTGNGSVGTTQSLAISTVNNLTFNLGSGTDTITVFGLNVAGNVSINGQASGVANVSIFAGLSNVTIGGSVQANFGGEAATFGVFGSGNGGGSLTVNGSVNVTEGGSGTQQVNIYGPPANNPSGGKLVIKGGLGIIDTGTGQSGLRIDDGVTIGGNVSFNNASNSVNSDIVQIFSNSNAFGVTAIGGSLSLALANSTYYGNSVDITGTGSLLPVTGATTITSGSGSDTISLRNAWFKNTVTIDTGSNLAYIPDQTIVQGSRFDGAVKVTTSGPGAQLGLGTLSSFAATVFNSTFSAQMTGPSDAIFLSNPNSTSNEVIFNSNVSFTGGSPVGTLFVQGLFSVGAGKLTMTNFSTTAPAAVKPKVTLSVQSNNVTLTSTDINNPNVSVTRSGNFVVFTGTGGTQITYTNNGSTGTTQSIPLSSVNNLTINLGTGFDTFAISGLSLTGNVSINGQATGGANVAISAGAPSVTIGGSIQANFGGETAVLNVFGSSNGGGSLTVNGSVNVTEGGSGNKQVNIYGPPANNPSGGKLAVKGAVSVLDSGNGKSGLRIDDGVTIGGNVSYDNSANTVYGDNVQIDSNSQAFGITSIGGTLSLALSSAAYSGDSVVISGFGSLLPVTGATTITSGAGSDTISLLNNWFKNTVTVNSGTSPSFSPDQVIVQGSRFDGAAKMTLSGPYAALGLGTVSSFAADVFNSTFEAMMTGPTSAIFLSNPTSASNEVIFNSTARMTGGSPAGTLFIQGRWFIGAGGLTRINFNVA